MLLEDKNWGGSYSPCDQTHQSRLDNTEEGPSRGHCVPEKSLYLAILLRGIRDAMGDTGPSYGLDVPKYTLEARRWILYSRGEKASELITFHECCQILNVDPDTIRKLVYDWIEEGVKFTPPNTLRWLSVTERLVE